MNMWVYLIILAIVQGIGEFLPISSSGHLAILGSYFGIKEDQNLTLGILLHAGSLVAIVIFYFKVLLGFFSKKNFHLLLMIFLGSIPCGVIGVTLKLTGLDDKIFSDPVSIALAFLVTGMLLRISGKEKMVAKSNGPDATDIENITVKQSLMVGCAQAFAILPGISRSGSTISMGLFTGVKREAAATFSFLLALPAVGGATFLELLSMLKSKSSGVDCSNLQLIAAVVISAVVSYFSLTLLVDLVKKGKLAWFSWYLFAIGAIVFLYEAYKLSGK